MRCLVAFLFAAVVVPLLLAQQPAEKKRPPARKPAAAAAVKYTLEESPNELVLKAPGFDVSVGRQGFLLSVSREGKLILESAQPGDAAQNLGFEAGGKIHAVGQLKSFKKAADRVVLEYDTTLSGASALVELMPSADSLQVRTWLLSNEGNLVPSLRYRLEPSGFWYGGGFQGWRDPQVFPLNQARISKNAFFAEGNTQGTPCWFSTAGVAVWVRTLADFRYSVNHVTDGRPDGLLSIEMPGVSSLAYEIVVGRNIRDVVDRLLKRFGYPRAVPPADYFRLPIYTTWVEHKTEVSQAKVLEFGRAIRDNKLPCGVIEIDDKWEQDYGDMKFDLKKFPDPKAMVTELHRLGYRVTLWVHPFVNTTTATYRGHRRDGFLVKDPDGDAGLIKWWQGIAAVWDFTNPPAAAAFRARLQGLQRDYGFDGFKFDGGDVNFTPRDLRAAKQIGAVEYADIYNREAAAHFPWNETRVGIYSQPLGIVQRLIDKHSVWGRENGLAAIVPEALTVSLRGFPYVMPDMVGGNQYDKDVMDEELLVRWAQASALMPLLQFSVGPWHHGEQAVRLSREASELHVRFAPYIFKLAQAAPRTGQPILAPLWYYAPDDKDTQAIFDQYMVGPDVVAAPVLAKGARQRDLYLPEGRWRDLRAGQVVEGRRWLRDYPTPLEVLPLFVREGSSAGKATQ